MLGIQLIGIIILLVTSELDCSSSRYLVYRNYNEKFRNLAVTSQFVYIGGNSKIIQLSSSLKYVNETKIESFPENWLLTLYKNDTLVVCNYKERTNYDTKCINYKVQLGLDKQIGNEYRDIKIKEVSARYVTSSMGETNILTIASSTCLEHYTKSQNCYAISSYLFHSDNWIEFKLQSNNDFKFIVEYIKPYKLVDFRVALKKDKFVYFLFNTKEGYSKLGKICTGGDDIRTNSYEDTPIICADNNKNYTLAQDAIFWNDYLFVAFTDDSSSVICRYDFMEIKKKFKESRQERLKCPYQPVDNTHFMNQMLSGNWCYNEEKQQCQGKTWVGY